MSDKKEPRTTGVLFRAEKHTMDNGVNCLLPRDTCERERVREREREREKESEREREGERERERERERCTVDREKPDCFSVREQPDCFLGATGKAKYGVHCLLLRKMCERERERERGNETRSANREKPDCFFGATGKAKRCPLPSAKEDVWERERESLARLLCQSCFGKAANQGVCVWKTERER